LNLQEKKATATMEADRSRLPGRRRLSAAAGLLAAMPLALAAPLPADAAEDYRARSGGPSHDQMVGRRTASPAEGLDFFRPVLTGVLYRAGFKGGDKKRTGLSDTQRRELCDAGFSEARYIDFGKNTRYGETKCASGTLDYKAGRSGDASEVMQAIHRVIRDPSRGPVVVHCMWGVHSSGAVSAMALVQFCGWSEERAKSYWDEARNNAGCSGGCDKWIDAHFASFKVDPALAITDAERAAICPK
jgi:hypothetical protein